MKKLIFLAVVSFMVFVLMSAPASLLLPYINQSPYFQAQSATGSIFAGQMQTTGKIDSLLYRVNLWQLLLANLDFKVRAVQGDNFIQTNVKIDLITQTVQLKDLTSRLNLALLQQYIPELSTVEPRGQLFLKDISVTWDDVRTYQIPQRLSGSIQLSKLNVLGQEFGDYQLPIETQAFDIFGVLSSKESAMTNTKIKLSLLNKKKQLVISGAVVGKNENVKAILQQLNISNIERIIRY